MFSRGGKKKPHMRTDLDVRHREYPDAPPELSLIPVVVYLPDDVDSIALLKRQLPERHEAAKCGEKVNTSKVNGRKHQPPKQGPKKIS